MAGCLALQRVRVALPAHNDAPAQPRQLAEPQLHRTSQEHAGLPARRTHYATFMLHGLPSCCMGCMGMGCMGLSSDVMCTSRDAHIK